MNFKFNIIYYGAGLLALLGIGAYLLHGSSLWNTFNEFLNGKDAPREISAYIESFTVEKPYLVARGENLGKVEVWTVPAGTEIFPEHSVHLGNAEKNGEEWRFEIPKNPLLISEIFAKGYDAQGQLVGEKTLLYTGASEIYDALWREEGELTHELILRVKEERIYENLHMTIARVAEDSRCPEHTTCVWAGRVQIEANFKLGNATSTALLSSDGGVYHFGVYSIEIIAVEPLPSLGKEIFLNDYRFRIRFSR